MNENFPAWYQSTRGPQVSHTIMSIVGSLLPALNLVLSSKGVNILPEDVNAYVSLAVFAFFSVQAAVGYVKAKIALSARISNLRAQVEALGGQPE